MAEVVERRRVIIEYENRISNDLGSMDSGPATTPVDMQAIVDAVREEFIRIGSRNPDIFGGRA